MCFRTATLDGIITLRKYVTLFGKQAMTRPFAYVALTFLVLTALVWTWANFTVSGRISVCLDDGGRWIYEQGKCEGARSTP